jgi:hypothetical protein
MAVDSLKRGEYGKIERKILAVVKEYKIRGGGVLMIQMK